MEMPIISHLQFQQPWFQSYSVFHLSCCLFSIQSRLSDRIYQSVVSRYAELFRLRLASERCSVLTECFITCCRHVHLHQQLVHSRYTFLSSCPHRGYCPALWQGAYELLGRCHTHPPCCNLLLTHFRSTCFTACSNTTSSPYHHVYPDYSNEKMLRYVKGILQGTQSTKTLQLLSVKKLFAHNQNM